MITFRICTIYNNLTMYEQMRNSFIAAGFNSENSVFHPLDNTTGNHYEPYSAYNEVLRTSKEPYIIFCHQDVLLNKEHGIEHLMAILKELAASDSQWAVLGNAGITSRYELVARITDPRSAPDSTPQTVRDASSAASLPCRVVSLDENFLLVKTAADIQLSDAMSGFHFYGPDLCLNAMRRGFSCYVVDFHLTHLSAGDTSSGSPLWQMRHHFADYWSRYYPLKWYPTVVTVVFFSRSKLVRRILSNRRTMVLMKTVFLRKMQKDLESVFPVCAQQ